MTLSPKEMEKQIVLQNIGIEPGENLKELLLVQREMNGIEEAQWDALIAEKIEGAVHNLWMGVGEDQKPPVTKPQDGDWKTIVLQRGGNGVGVACVILMKEHSQEQWWVTLSRDRSGEKRVVSIEKKPQPTSVENRKQWQEQVYDKQGRVVEACRTETNATTGRLLRTAFALNHEDTENPVVLYCAQTELENAEGQEHWKPLQHEVDRWFARMKEGQFKSVEQALQCWGDCVLAVAESREYFRAPKVLTVSEALKWKSQQKPLHDLSSTYRFEQTKILHQEGLWGSLEGFADKGLELVQAWHEKALWACSQWEQEQRKDSTRGATAFNGQYKSRYSKKL